MRPVVKYQLEFKSASARACPLWESDFPPPEKEYLWDYSYTKALANSGFSNVVVDQ